MCSKAQVFSFICWHLQPFLGEEFQICLYLEPFANQLKQIDCGAKGGLQKTCNATMKAVNLKTQRALPNLNETKLKKITNLNKKLKQGVFPSK